MAEFFLRVNSFLSQKKALTLGKKNTHKRRRGHFRKPTVRIQSSGQSG